MQKKLLIFFLLLFSGLPSPCLGSEQLDPLLQGKQFLETGESDRAYEYFWILVQNTPQDASFNFYLGKAALAKGDYEAAVMAFERVLIIDPFVVAVKAELAKSFYAMGATETAIHYFEESLQGELNTELRLEITELLEKLKKTEQ
ncbi:MAG: tetratricopeptide repeat protein [Desulfobulbaceae bacterium]|nr:tetratricopeptide repeat protein [Desulfobulbaceae bacterium]